MDNTIRVGSVVFHKPGTFVGPGTVVKVTHDDLIGVDCFTVFWQASGEKWDHFRSSLLTLAERHTSGG